MRVQCGLEDVVFCEEAASKRNSDQREHKYGEKRGGSWFSTAEACEIIDAHIALATGSHVADNNEGPDGHQSIRCEIKHRGGHTDLRISREGDENVAGVRNGAVSKQTLYIGLRQSREVT